jgi:hypothetical protein
MGFVRKIGRKIDKAIIQPVLNTVEAVIEDPRKLAMVALSVMAPGAGTALGSALGLSGTAATMVGQAAINTALNGGDIKAGIMAAAIPVVGKELASTAATSFMESGMDKALAESAGKVVSGTAISAAQGKDPLSALISGGLSEGTAAVTRDIPGFSDLPDAAKRSINAAVATELSGGDGTQAAVNAAISAGTSKLAEYTNSLNNPNKEDFIEGYFRPGGEGYINPNITDTTGLDEGPIIPVNEAPTSDVVDQLLNTGMPSPDDDFVPTIPTVDEPTTPQTGGVYDEITGEFIPGEGPLQGPLGPETGNIDPDKEWEYSLTKPGVWTSKDGEEIDLSYMPDRDTAMTGAELMKRAGAMPGGAKAPAKTAAPGAKTATPTTPGAKTGTNPAVDAITNLANQQQQYQNSVLNMMMNDKNEVANIKSFKDLYGTDLFGSSYIPPSAMGAPTGYAPAPQMQMQDDDVEQFFKGGDVSDINTLLQILRG